MRPKRPSTYHHLSVADKQSQFRDRMREPSTTCPVCEMHLTVPDLLVHIDQRCPGRRDPHPRARWISWAGVIRLGVPKQTLHRWVENGWVQVRWQDSGKRRYLLREVVWRAALRRARRPGKGKTR